MQLQDLSGVSRSDRHVHKDLWRRCTNEKLRWPGLLLLVRLAWAEYSRGRREFLRSIARRQSIVLWRTIPTPPTILATTADVYEEVLMDRFSIALLAHGFGQCIRHSLCLLSLSCLVV